MITQVLADDAANFGADVQAGGIKIVLSFSVLSFSSCLIN